MTKARSNATANAAKGDLTVGNGTNLSGVLGVGSNGDTIVADSSTATGLSYQANFAAGKNKLINGNFGIWQRGTSFSTTASLTYTADRWWTNAFSGTATVSQQTFTAGTAPVAGYEGQFFLRFASTSTFTQLGQRIEDVRVFAGQTVTMSFWAKAASALSLQPYFEQNFGSGGSASTFTAGTSASVTTSWQRFTATVSVPSVSGKTIGTSSFLNFYFLTGTLNTNIDVWGVQVEAGSVATAFQTATGTVQGELAACQRYYFRASADTAYAAMNATGYLNTTTNALMYVTVPVTMRVAPTAVDFSTLRVGDVADAYTTISNVTLDSVVNQRSMPAINCTVSGATAFRWARLQANNSTSAFIGFSAEL
jgi:hypothetical protein